MAYLYTPKLELPLESWKVNSTGFLQLQSFSGIDWGKHLGEDCITKPGTSVLAIGRGRVVYSWLHASLRSPEKEGQKESNWGNIIIIAHKNPKTKKAFFSLYGHLSKRFIGKGDRVSLGQKIGTVAEGWTRENGWWKETHLHFAIYIGPWKGVVLSGAYRERKRTNIRYWTNPTEFIKSYRSS